MSVHFLSVLVAGHASDSAWQTYGWIRPDSDSGSARGLGRPGPSVGAVVVELELPVNQAY